MTYACSDRSIDRSGVQIRRENKSQEELFVNSTGSKSFPGEGDARAGAGSDILFLPNRFDPHTAHGSFARVLFTVAW